MCASKLRGTRPGPKRIDPRVRRATPDWRGQARSADNVRTTSERRVARLYNSHH
jgi:hypothetical protein